jgi:hypothetical protein
MEQETQNESEKTLYLSCAETAKLVRKALKEEFPKQKFSVRSHTYSGGASIHVDWENGVSEPAVKAVIKRFEGAGFDGMIDLKYYKNHWMLPDGTVLLAESEGTQNSAGVYPAYKLDKPCEGARKVSMGADYVFADRHVSDELRIQVAKDIASAEGKEFKGMEDYPVEGRIDNWWIVVHQFLYDKDLTNYQGVERTDCTCGSYPNDFLKLKEVAQ